MTVVITFFNFIMTKIFFRSKRLGVSLERLYIIQIDLIQFNELFMFRISCKKEKIPMHKNKDTIHWHIYSDEKKCRDPPNVPCSAERSGEGSVIFSEFSVPLFKGGTGKVWGTFIFPFLSYFIFTQAKKKYKFQEDIISIYLCWS